MILEKHGVIFSQVGKVNLLNLDFSGKWECFRLIVNFKDNWEKKMVPESRPSFVQRKHLNFIVLLYEPPHGKTNNLHRRKQRRRSASR